MVWWCQLATELINDLGSFFKRLQLVRLPGRTPHKTDNDRHDAAWQLNRRRNIALARNRLLSAALGLIADQNVNWVVWLDVDIRHIPRDLIRYLLSANQSVVVPNCLWRMDNGQVTRQLRYSYIINFLNFQASVTWHVPSRRTRGIKFFECFIPRTQSDCSSPISYNLPAGTGRCPCSSSLLWSLCKLPVDLWLTTSYDTIRYDSVYLTCSTKLTGSQLSLPHGIIKN